MVGSGTLKYWFVRGNLWRRVNKMTECNCDCHKKSAESDLVKCRKASQRKTTEITELKRKLLIATVAIAVGGTLVGKEALDRVLQYFQTYDKVKQAVDKVTINSDHEISMPTYIGVSPAPSTLAIFGVAALMPTRRRR